MKLHHSNRTDAGLTLVEVVATIAVLGLIFALLLPFIAAHRTISSSLSCVNNLKQVGLSFRLWEGDNNDKYPMDVSVTNGGAMELVATGNVAACFMAMSNQLSTPKILICPEDGKRQPAATFFEDTELKNKISYFIGVEATESKPQMFLSGDDNLEVSSVPLKSGLTQITTNTNIAWLPDRHVDGNTRYWTPINDKIYGNVAFADGSVQELTTTDLRKNTNAVNIRLAIP